MFATRMQLVRKKISELTDKANKMYNMQLPPIEVRFDLQGRAAGQAGMQGTHCYMRFNIDMMRNDGWDHLFNDTVPHELAHIVCFVNKSDRGHGPQWRATCQRLGGSGERCHKEQVVYANGKTFYYTSSTGAVVVLSQVRHRKIQRGSVYTFRDKGEVNKFCSYSTTAPTKPAVIPPAAPASKPAVATTAAPVGTSKADLVRAEIVRYKAAGGKMHADVQNWAVRTLGMSRGLAITYVRNNW
jgi:SprT protein